MNTGKQTFNSGIHGINQEHYRGNAGYKGPAIHDNAEINPAPHKNLLHWRGVSVIGGMFLLILVLAAVSTLIHNKSEQSHSTITKVEARHLQPNTVRPTSALISKNIAEEPKPDSKERQLVDPVKHTAHSASAAPDDKTTAIQTELVHVVAAVPPTHTLQEETWKGKNTVILTEPAGNITADTRQRILSYYVKLASNAKAQGQENHADFYTFKARAMLFGQHENR